MRLALLFRRRGEKAARELGGDSLFQRRLIVFDDEEVVAAPVTDLLANISLAEHRVARDHAALEQPGSSRFPDAPLCSLVLASTRRLAQHATGASDPAVPARWTARSCGCSVPHRVLPSRATASSDWSVLDTPRQYVKPSRPTHARNGSAKEPSAVSETLPTWEADG